ncbi:hypothetical protein VTN02DRAFT_2952 [Thermoascus thermophilus]
MNQRFTFTLFGLVPVYTARVTLTSVITLTTTTDNKGNSLVDSVSKPTKPSPGPTAAAAGSGVKYYIAAQEDLYQTSQWIRFLLPWGIGASVVLLGHVFAAVVCTVGAIVLWPVTWAEERGYLPLRMLWKGELGQAGLEFDARGGKRGRRTVVSDVSGGVTYIGIAT